MLTSAPTEMKNTVPSVCTIDSREFSIRKRDVQAEHHHEREQDENAPRARKGADPRLRRNADLVLAECAPVRLERRSRSPSAAAG